MSHHDLLEYINSAKRRGATDQMITERLQLGGWYAVDIHDALQLHRTLMSTEVPVVAQRISAPAVSYIPTESVHHTSARKADTVALAVFAFAVGLFGYIWLVR